MTSKTTNFKISQDLGTQCQTTETFLKQFKVMFVAIWMVKKAQRPSF